MPETTIQRISRKTGRFPVSCKCSACKSQCLKSCCLGTPEDIERLIDAGHGSRIKPTTWAAGIMMGITDDVIEMFQAEFSFKSGCTFLTPEGLCSLHDTGLKPTEGKLSHHTIKRETSDRKRNLTWNVAKTWLDPENQPIIDRIKEKMKSFS